MRERCERCLWFGDCFAEEGCGHFTPLEDELDNAVERNRFAYRAAWFEYVDEDKLLGEKRYGKAVDRTAVYI